MLRLRVVGTFARCIRSESDHPAEHSIGRESATNPVVTVSARDNQPVAFSFDLLIALLATVAILDVVLGRGSSGAPTTTLWFCLPALANVGTRGL